MAGKFYISHFIANPETLVAFLLGVFPDRNVFSSFPYCNPIAFEIGLLEVSNYQMTSMSNCLCTHIIYLLRTKTLTEEVRTKTSMYFVLVGRQS